MTYDDVNPVKRSYTSSFINYFILDGALQGIDMFRAPSTRSNCPDIDKFLRPTVKYVSCHVCNGQVEIWSDEDEGECLSCGSTWTKPESNASCLDYCQYADKCKAIISTRKPKN